MVYRYLDEVAMLLADNPIDQNVNNTRLAYLWQVRAEAPGRRVSKTVRVRR